MNKIIWESISVWGDESGDDIIKFIDYLEKDNCIVTHIIPLKYSGSGPLNSDCYLMKALILYNKREIIATSAISYPNNTGGN